VPRGISILICTLNGAGTIIPTLKALARAECPPPAEILLIDNGSSDGVSILASEYWEKEPRPFPLRVLHEAEKGKSYAIRTGVQTAQYDLVLICDDDNALAPNYLSTAVRIMEDPEIGCAGGAGIPHIIGETPPHFYNFATWFAVGAQVRTPEEAEQSLVAISDKHHDMIIWGAGSVFRRQDLAFLYTLPGFPLISGRYKCEDAELCHAVVLLGRKLVYSPQLRFEHILASHRLECSRLTRRHDYDDQNQSIIDAYVEARRGARDAPILGSLKAFRRYLRAKLGGGSNARKYLFGAWIHLRLKLLMLTEQQQVFAICKAIAENRKMASH
jgi:glycosyltransferase involved in cell wall biosynthesis